MANLINCVFARKVRNFRSEVHFPDRKNYVFSAATLPPRREAPTIKLPKGYPLPPETFLISNRLSRLATYFWPPNSRCPSGRMAKRSCGTLPLLPQGANVAPIPWGASGNLRNPIRGIAHRDSRPQISNPLSRFPPSARPGARIAYRD